MRAMWYRSLCPICHLRTWSWRLQRSPQLCSVKLLYKLRATTESELLQNFINKMIIWRVWMWLLVDNTQMNLSIVLPTTLPSFHLDCQKGYNLLLGFLWELPASWNSWFFFLKILFMLRDRGREGESERERNINVQEIHWSVAFRMPPTGDLAHHPGMCSDWESNQRPFGLQASTQSTEPH